MEMTIWNRLSILNYVLFNCKLRKSYSIMKKSALCTSALLFFPQMIFKKSICTIHWPHIFLWHALTCCCFELLPPFQGRCFFPNAASEIHFNLEIKFSSSNWAPMRAFNDFKDIFPPVTEWLLVPIYLYY